MQKRTRAVTLSEFSESTTLHGLNRTCNVSSHKAKRLVWLVILFAMVGVYIFIAISSIITYFNWESVTKIAKTTKKELEFPSVSICFQNLWSRSMFEGRPEAEYWVRYLETHSYRDLTENERVNATRALDINLYHEAAARLNFQTLLERCEFDAEVFDCEERFIWQNSESSSCVTFMIPADRERYGTPVIRTPGMLFGLSK